MSPGQREEMTDAPRFQSFRNKAPPVVHRCLSLWHNRLANVTI